MMLLGNNCPKIGASEKCRGHTKVVVFVICGEQNFILEHWSGAVARIRERGFLIISGRCIIAVKGEGGR